MTKNIDSEGEAWACANHEDERMFDRAISFDGPLPEVGSYKKYWKQDESHYGFQNGQLYCKGQGLDKLNLRLTLIHFDSKSNLLCNQKILRMIRLLRFLIRK